MQVDASVAGNPDKGCAAIQKRRGSLLIPMALRPLGTRTLWPAPLCTLAAAKPCQRASRFAQMACAARKLWADVDVGVDDAQVAGWTALAAPLLPPPAASRQPPCRQCLRVNPRCNLSPLYLVAVQ